MSVREWLLEQGGKSGLDTLHIDEQCSDTGRGVRTERRIEQGEAIISIPMEAVLTGNGFVFCLIQVNTALVHNVNPLKRTETMRAE